MSIFVIYVKSFLIVILMWLYCDLNSETIIPYIIYNQSQDFFDNQANTLKIPLI